MKAFHNIQNIYFIGIGGIGMSALARYFLLNKKNVAGYDKTPTAITRQLENEGIPVSFNDKIEEVPKAFTKTENTLVVYTPAVSAQNPVYQFFYEGKFAIKKRAEVLGMITSGRYTLAVAGTHGKTTTTAILAHILKQSGVKLTAFLGGISENYQSNFIADGNEAIVVEADEFDRSFLHLSPTIAAITSTDVDHLDIYKEAGNLMDSFRQFAQKVPQPEGLFIKKGLDFSGKTIGIEEEADFQLKNISIHNGSYQFNFQYSNKTIEKIEFSLPGRHNLMNAATAIAMAIHYGVSEKKIKLALANFTGVHRRFTYHLKTKTRTLIEDYAHHPEEIKAVYQAICEMHPRKKTLGVFQPHLYSRTRDFADEFSEALTLFDELLLLDIYPAREEPIPGINSEMLLNKIENKAKKLITKTMLPEAVQKSDAEIIVLMGAGDIGNEVNNIKIALKHEG